MDLAAAADFQRFYGKFFSVWKAWDSLSRHRLETKDPAETTWECLNRAAEVEGHVEALLARIQLSINYPRMILMSPGGVRQGFQSLRGAIKRTEPLEWRSSEAKEHLAFKGLAAYASRFLGTSSSFKRAPDNAMAAENFRKNNQQ